MLPVTKINCAERSCIGKNTLKKKPLRGAPSLNLNSGHEILTMVHISSVFMHHSRALYFYSFYDIYQMNSMGTGIQEFCQF